MATSISDAVRRLLVGRPFRSDHYRTEALPKRTAMPVFASDMLSSVAYAPDEILLSLAASGLVALTVSPWVGLAVGVVILVVVLCYRLNLRAYPGGGGDYEVATKNLGRKFGLGAAAALLVDYVLTLAVSTTVFAGYIGAAFPVLAPHRTWVAVVGIVLVMLVGLRGSFRARGVLAAPTYLFLAAVVTTVVVGTFRILGGDVPVAETTGFTVVPDPGANTLLVGLGAAFIVLRSFSAGSVALAGAHTVATAVPRFAAPRGVNAARTLVLTGGLSAFMLVGLTWLAQRVGVVYVADPQAQLVMPGGGAVAEDYRLPPVLAQLSEAVFSGAPLVSFLVLLVTALVLLVAANTAIEGFPGLASRLARDSFLPHQLATRGDRMTFTNGILLLAAAAAVLVVGFEARAPELIQLYLVGVFVAFMLGQLGMMKHWRARIRRMVASPTRLRMRVNLVVNTVGFVIALVVLGVAVVTKFLSGAWLALAAMVVLYLGMGLIHRHYTRVERELAPEEDESERRALPSNVHAVVVVTDVHKPTLRAISFARAARPTFLQAVSVAVDEDAADSLQKDWDDLRMPVPLTVLASPYRELVRPIMNHIGAIRQKSPRDLVVVYIPQYIVGRWWENWLHNQTVLRLKSRLLIVPNVVVATVPWRLRSFRRNRDALLRRAGDIDKKALDHL
ncbi:APC family permease [Brevibacterium litoralis]|uniref:APC family permease n=1 Tax=Brevibacterium litoralis TaxID=3138935 RepID=UPI0032F09D4B